MSFDLCLSQIIHQFFFFLLFMISIHALLIPGVSLLKCKKLRSDENMCPKAKQEFRMHRDAKCHEYDEYIRVKIFSGWGKKSWRRCNLAKFSLFWEDLHNYARFLCSVYKLA